MFKTTITKSIIFTFFFFISVLILNAQNNEQNVYKLSDELRVTQIDTNIYLVAHSFPGEANSLVIKFKNGKYLFIDTPYTDEATEELCKWLQSRDENKIHVTAINTHFHIDNLGGNGYLEKTGADVYGSDLTCKLLKERGLGNGMLDMLKSSHFDKCRNYYENVKLLPPNKTFTLDKGITLKFDDDAVIVFYPGPGHAPDNVAVYYPAKQLLFGGCLVKSMGTNSKGNTGDADLEHWASSLQNLQNRFPDAKIVIPGHGKIGDISLIKHSIEIVSQ